MLRHVRFETVSTHSRAEAAARKYHLKSQINAVSTHSRAEAAAIVDSILLKISQCFNTQPRGGGCIADFNNQ